MTPPDAAEYRAKAAAALDQERPGDAVAWALLAAVAELGAIRGELADVRRETARIRRGR